MAAKNAAVAAGGNHGRLKKMCFTVSMNTYFKCIFLWIKKTKTKRKMLQLLNVHLEAPAVNRTANILVSESDLSPNGNWQHNSGADCCCYVL